MNRHVNSIAGRLSLRPPQRRSLEILDRITEIVKLDKDADCAAALAAIHREYPTVQDFEREFPSLCFALATGVGKTRLMGAFISYLHLAHNFSNFFVLAPNLTIYQKLIADFTPNTAKYVFRGIAEFATQPPQIITGDNYATSASVRPGLVPGYEHEVHINIFNISKINSEVRGGKAPRIKRLSEYIGQSYFDYLASLQDLVLLMDESHRYRASAGVRAINELRPVLGLELTATPFVETARGAIPFKNVIYDYPLAQAMQDGFVKEPAVVTQKNFDPSQFTPDQLEKIKLEDGLRLHENTKVELETYARQASRPVVKPFMLVIARDTTHAGQLMKLVQSEAFFGGQYQAKVIQVDSSKTGAEEDEMVARLLAVEDPAEPTEIVIHVNMLKEGWDVTNLYTIVPLRAANARILIEQSIGRGLRLPYGKRTGVSAVDRLNIVAHDRFQEIVDEANRPDSVIRLQQVILDPDRDLRQTRTVVTPSTLAVQLGAAPAPSAALVGAGAPAAGPTVLFASEAEQEVARVTYAVIKKHEGLPTSGHLLKESVQQQIVEEVKQALLPAQAALPGLDCGANVAAVVARAAELVVAGTIDIPRILVIPRGEANVGFHPFTLDTAAIRYPPVDRALVIQSLPTGRQETLGFSPLLLFEQRPEDHLVRGLVDFPDISYDDHADLLYDLAGQMVQHLRGYLSEDDARNVLIYHQKELARYIHAQMQAHQWEKATGYDVKVSKGFTELKVSAYTAGADEPIYDFRRPVAEKSRIKQMLFGGFQRCLYPYQKFQSDPERVLAIILDREAQKWIKPAQGQFQIFHRGRSSLGGGEQAQYVPDFVAETDRQIYMLEVKARDELTDEVVLAKQEAARQWCERASMHNHSHGGKPWVYGLIRDNLIAENMTLAGLVNR